MAIAAIDLLSKEFGSDIALSEKLGMGRGWASNARRRRPPGEMRRGQFDKLTALLETVTKPPPQPKPYVNGRNGIATPTIEPLPTPIPMDTLQKALDEIQTHAAGLLSATETARAASQSLPRFIREPLHESLQTVEQYAVQLEAIGASYK